MTQTFNRMRWFCGHRYIHRRDEWPTFNKMWSFCTHIFTGGIQVKGEPQKAEANEIFFFSFSE